jgi:DNA-binding NarL/FixJ family response regulator
MADEGLRVHLVGDDGRLARALRRGRVRLVDGDGEADLVVRVQAVTRDDVGRLTQREFEVLEQMGSGATNLEIAETLYIAENTVKNHVRSILLKMSAKSRTEAVVVAHQRGLLHL